MVYKYIVFIIYLRALNTRINRNSVYRGPRFVSDDIETIPSLSLPSHRQLVGIVVVVVSAGQPASRFVRRVKRGRRVMENKQSGF